MNVILMSIRNREDEQIKMFPTDPAQYDIRVRYALMIMIIVAVLYLIRVIALYRIFSKAGLPAWKAVIPFYSEYLLTVISWKKKVWAAVLVVCDFFYALTKIGGSYSEPAIITFELILAIVLFLITAVRSFKLSRAFGHSTGFGVGLLFLDLIFLLILGYGKDTYLGPQD